MEKLGAQFLNQIDILLQNARNSVKTAVNLTMVYTYYDIGRMIIEEEQNGVNRAEYGKYILNQLSAYLTNKFGKGFSVTNLKQMRQFYMIYSHDKIGQTLSDQFKGLSSVEPERKFVLSWSHYLQLMRITNVNERHFYEIEGFGKQGTYQKNTK